MGDVAKGVAHGSGADGPGALQRNNLNVLW